MVFLDYASTTPVDKEIQDSYFELINKYFANAASSHKLGVVVDSLQNRAREQIASYFGANSNNVIFTSGASEANNLALKGVAFNYANRGKHIITSSIEHKSVLETCKQLETIFGYSVTYLDPNSDGVISLASLKSALKEDTILVSLMAVNNEIGSINNINELASYVKNNSKAFFHCDATQAIGKINVNFSNVDMITVSAHKIYGFKGSGCLIKKDNVTLTPLINGGGQEFGYRSGTANWPINVMLAKTLRLAIESKDKNYEQVKAMHDEIYNVLINTPNVMVNSPKEGSPYIINFAIKNKLASTIAQAFETYGIYISTISACSSHSGAKSHVVANTFKDDKRAESSVRLSLSKLTTKEDVKEFINAFNKIVTSLKDGN